MAKDRGYSVSQRSLITLSHTFVAVAIVVLLYWGRPVLLPIAMATLLTFVLNPVVYGFQRLGIGAVTSVLLSVSIVASALTGMGAIGSRQVAMLLDELPENTSRVVAKVKSLRAITESPTTRRFGTMFDEIGKELNLSPVPTDSPTLIIDPSIGRTAPAVPVVVDSGTDYQQLGRAYRIWPNHWCFTHRVACLGCILAVFVGTDRINSFIAICGRIGGARKEYSGSEISRSVAR